jgi:hypothetical protein
MPVPRLCDARTLLAAWEAAAPLPEVARAAQLVAHDGAGPVEAVLDLPLGECALLAVTAYIEAFGAEADCACPCGVCGEALDVLLDLRDYADAAGSRTEEVATVVNGARSFAVRPLSTRDLLAAARTSDPALALRRCCLRDESGRAPSAAELQALGADDLAAVDAAADHLAGIASILLRMRCPSCGEDTAAAVDLGGLLWERVAATAPRLLAEVAALARAFGWSEDAVLSLGGVRRRAYLQLATALTGEPGGAVVGS